MGRGSLTEKMLAEPRPGRGERVSPVAACGQSTAHDGSRCKGPEAALFMVRRRRARGLVELAQSE